MTDNSTNKPGGAFWGISIFAVIWNIMGVMAYLGTAFMTDEALAMLPEEQQQLYTDVPSWAMAAFAIAVWFGILGSILLLLRKRWAKPVFMISLVYTLFVSKNIEVYGPGGYVMPVLVLIIGIFLVWYSKDADTKGILK